MIPDPRLNALIVEANPTDLAFVEQMLRVIDKESSETDIETAGVTRLIPVIHSTADEVATVVRQVFADRIGTTQGGGQGQQPSPEDFLRALRGQRSRREDSQTRGELQKMIIGVDSRSNSVIVTGPEPLYRQVEALVRQIDQPGSTDTDVVSVVPIKVSDPELVQKTLNSILGASSRSGSRSSSGSSPSGGSSGGPSPDDIRRRMEFFQQLRGSGGPPGGFGGPPGGFGSSGGDRSGGSRSFGGRSRGR
jgi:type II secretory pathway component GspD/PulD (secretin)